MIDRKNIKEMSRQQLNRNRNWIVPVILSAVTFLITGYYPNNMSMRDSSIMSLSIALVMTTLNIFMTNSCLQIAKSKSNETVGWAKILITLKTFIKCILYSILISLIELTVTLGAVLIGSMYLIKIPILGTVILIIALFIGGIISIYCTFSVFTILDKDVNVFEAISMSIHLIRGYFWKIIILSLSFILWYLLGAITLGIAMFWVVPYMTVTYSNYYLLLYDEKYS